LNEFGIIQMQQRYLLDVVLIVLTSTSYIPCSFEY